MALTIKTNNVPRLLMYSYQLTAKELREFDYMDADELESASFVRYHGYVYDIGNFMRCGDNPDLKGWHGYASDSFFSGTLIRLCDDSDYVVVGTYCS